MISLGLGKECRRLKQLLNLKARKYLRDNELVSKEYMEKQWINIEIYLMISMMKCLRGNILLTAPHSKICQGKNKD
jgi:hypothetical protein